MRLPRPYIPLRIRREVAERQAIAAGVYPRCNIATWPLGSQLRELLYVLFGDEKVELHHRPALCNRDWQPDEGYIPDANDPEYLIYVTKADHDIETRVRGQHGDHSDLAKVRIRKRKEKKHDQRSATVSNAGHNRWGARRPVHNRSHVPVGTPKLKRKWPKRKIPSRVKPCE